jgi:hypothetical protein
LTSGQDTGGVSQQVGQDNLLNLLTKDFLDRFAKLFVFLLFFLTSLLLFLIFLEFNTILGDTDQLLVFVFLELGSGIFINRVSHQQDLNTLLLETFKERRVLDGSARFTSDVVDVLLLLGHAGDVVLEGGHLITRLGGVVTEEISELTTVLGIFVDTELDVLGEGLVELVELFLIFGNFLEHFKTLLDQVLTDNLKDLVLLEHFTRNVEREIFRVDNTLDEAEPFRDQVFTVIHDEDTTDVELDVVSLLLGLKHVKGSTLGDIEDGTELKLTFNREVLDRQMVFPVVREGLVEFSIIFRLDIIRVTGPQGLGLVKLLIFSDGLLDSLLLLFLLIIFIGDFLNLGTFGGRLFFLLIIGDFLLNFLLNDELDGVRDELRVLLDDVLDLLLIEVLELYKWKVKESDGKIK